MVKDPCYRNATLLKYGLPGSQTKLYECSIKGSHTCEYRTRTGEMFLCLFRMKIEDKLEKLAKDLS